MRNMFYIYMYENKINGKVYIGQMFNVDASLISRIIKGNK